MGIGKDEPRYITRLMKMECDMGTVQNYINVDKDHGVLAGGNSDAQPVMNANDHTSKNVIHFGNCNSKENPERGLRETLVKTVMGATLGPIIAFGVGDKIIDKLEEMGILTYKCKPNTPKPWIDANEDCILEGAPALTMDSQLACRYGGRITFVPVDSADAGDLQGAGEGDAGEAAPEPKDVVKEAFDEAVNAAMDEISETGETGKETVEKVQTALILASAMPAQEGSMLGQDQTQGGEMYSQEQIQEGEMYSQEQIQYNGMDSNEMFTDQSAMDNSIGIYENDITSAGSSAAALYNTVQSIDPDAGMTFEQAVRQMEPYGTIENTVLGTIPLGITSALNKMGYQTQYCFSTDLADVSREAANADAAVMMYATTKNCECVAFHADPAKQAAQERTFTFCNEAGKAKGSMTLNTFDTLLSDQGLAKLGAITITVNKPDKQLCVNSCAGCRGDD